jgi:hypothetical protein
MGLFGVPIQTRLSRPKSFEHDYSFDYRQDLADGTPSVLTCQTVELIKRPGQSLGLFLREGNGVTRADGMHVVFVCEAQCVTRRCVCIALWRSIGVVTTSERNIRR